jgi:hypothetical protein
MRGRTLTFLVVVASVVSPALVVAEEPASPLVPSSSSSRATLLPSPQRLQLTWPVAPVSFAFRGWDAGSSATGPLLAFDTRSLWLQSGRLSLHSLASAAPSAALDCGGLTCQPTLLRSVGVEGRVHLYSGTVVREAHGFARYESQWAAKESSKGGAHVLSFGLGGTLDL